MRLVLMMVLVVLLGMSASFALQFHSIETSRAKARADNAAVWRSVVCYIEESGLRQAKTGAQRKDLTDFWDQLLIERIHTKPC